MSTAHRPVHPLNPTPEAEAVKEKVRAALRRGFKECGSQAEFHRKLCVELERRGERVVSKQAVNWWAMEGTLVDKKYWRPIEVITECATTRRTLRPDLYPDEA